MKNKATLYLEDQDRNGDGIAADLESRHLKDGAAEGTLAWILGNAIEDAMRDPPPSGIPARTASRSG